MMQQNSEAQMSTGRPSAQARKGLHDHYTRSSPEPSRGDYSSLSSDSDAREEPNVDIDGPYSPLRRDVARYRKEYLKDSSSSPGDNESPHPEPKEPSNTEGWGCGMWIILIVGLLSAVCAAGVLGYMDMFLITSKSEEKLWGDLKDSILNIHSKFPSQMKEIWNTFYFGTMKVLLEKPTEPTVFLLLYQGAATTSCLAHEVARTVHSSLGASASSPLELDGVALGRNASLLEDHGRLIQDFGPLVEQHRVLVLDNLQAVPANIARALHFFCDTVSPLVRKAIYIFTLNVGNAEGKPMRVAERALNTAWSQLDPDILNPLIVRVTGGFVLKISPEEGGC